MDEAETDKETETDGRKTEIDIVAVIQMTNEEERT